MKKRLLPILFAGLMMGTSVPAQAMLTDDTNDLYWEGITSKLPYLQKQSGPLSLQELTAIAILQNSALCDQIQQNPSILNQGQHRVLNNLINQLEKSFIMLLKGLAQHTTPLEDPSFTDHVIPAAESILAPGILKLDRMHLDEQKKQSINDLLVSAIYNKNKRLVHYLLQANVDLETQDNTPLGMTALHYAILCGSLEYTTLLLEAGANPMARNKFGSTPLKTANNAINWSETTTIKNQIIKLLTRYGAH